MLSSNLRQFSAIGFFGNHFMPSVHETCMTKKCASPNCNENHDGRECNGCYKYFCEDCYNDFEKDYDFDYSDGSMAGHNAERFCEKCA